MQGFAAVSRRYAAQQTKWFRSEPSFEWVAADWDAPSVVEAAVSARVLCSRAEYDAGLAAPEQAELRRLDPKLDKAMKTYAPNLPSFESDEAMGAMLERADECRARLEPRLDELLAADVAMSERFPWHRREAEQDEAGSPEQPSKKAKRAASPEADKR